MQPTPEQWWTGLTDDDRVAFRQAANERALTPQLAEKLRGAGVLVAMVGFVDADTYDNVFPGPYAKYALEH